MRTPKKFYFERLILQVILCLREFLGMQKVICEILGIGCRFLLSKNLCFRYSLFPLARFQITDGRGELGVRSGCHRPAVGSIYDFLCRNLTWLFADAN